MKEQTCTKCKILKPLTEFSRGNNKIGLQYKCKTCNKNYAKENKTKIKKKAKKYREENKEKIREGGNEYAKRNRDRKKAYDKKYRQQNKEKIASYKKNYRAENLDKIRESDRKYKQFNKEKIREYYKQKAKTDPLFKVKRNLRNRIRRALKNKMGRKTKELLGADFETVKKHIENTFIEGMSWENYGACKDGNCSEVWHIDHKIPFASAKTKEELIKLCHYKNLQALWAADNLSKNKY